MLKNIKHKWQKFLEVIAQQNKRSYGEGSLNCCDLKAVTKKSSHFR